MATKDQVYEFARQEAERQGVPFSLVQKIVETESQGIFNAIGPKTRTGDRAYGPMQLMSATAKDLGVNRMDWKDNIRGGVKYLGQLSSRFQDPTLVAAAYNAGPANGPVPEFPDIDLIKSCSSHCAVPVIAEGRYNSPELVSQAFDAGAWSVCVGSAITDPWLSTKRFIKAINNKA